MTDIRFHKYDELPELLTVAEAAAFLTLTEASLRGMCERGDGPPYIRLSPRKMRFRKSDIFDWLANNHIGMTGTPN